MDGLWLPWLVSAAGGTCLLLAASIQRNRNAVMRVGWTGSQRGPGAPFAVVTRLRAFLPVTAASAIGAVVFGPVGAVGGAASGWVLKRLLRRRAAIRTAAALEVQLVDATAAISAGLRAGLSMTQAIAHAAAEAEAPLRPRLEEVLRLVDLGEGLDRALGRWADTSSSPDVRLVADVVRLHHRVGGDAPEVLKQVAESLQHRRTVGAELRSLTAQARLSGVILGSLPVGFFLFLSVVSRSDVSAALSAPLGKAAVVLGLLLEFGAFLWIRSILQVRVS